MNVRDRYSEDQIIVHQVSKEDQDLILEYNLVEKREIPKVNFLRIRIDNFASRNELVVKIMDLADGSGNYQIFGVDPFRIMHIRNKVTLRRILNKAKYVFSAGGGIRWASRKMHNPIETWVNPISLIVDLVRLSEVKKLPIFFLGGRSEIIERAYFNLKKSFPKMRIVGRHTGFFNSEREKDVIEVIRKTSPKILFVGMSYPKDLEWIDRNRKHFNNITMISVGHSFDVISGKIKRAPDYFQNRGLVWFYQILSRPYRILAWLKLLYFGLLTYFYHFFRSRKK